MANYRPEEKHYLPQEEPQLIWLLNCMVMKAHKKMHEVKGKRQIISKVNF